MTASDVLGTLFVVGLLVGLIAIANDIAKRDIARRAQEDEVARQRAAERAANPPSADVLLHERLDRIEAANFARYTSLKSRIFWTPLLWAVIGAALWLIAMAVTHA